MADVRVPSNSKLNFAMLLSTSGALYWGMPDFSTIDPADDDILHEVVGGDRIDNISYRYYGRPDRGWIIALANGIEVYPNQINVGAMLRIPSPQRVGNVILPLAARARQGRL